MPAPRGGSPHEIGCPGSWSASPGLPPKGPVSHRESHPGPPRSACPCRRWRVLGGITSRDRNRRAGPPVRPGPTPGPPLAPNLAMGLRMRTAVAFPVHSQQPPIARWPVQASRWRRCPGATKCWRRQRPGKSVKEIGGWIRREEAGPTSAQILSIH